MRTIWLRARAQAFHDRDGIHALLQVRLDGGGHAQRRDDQRDQADQAQVGGGAIQAARDHRMRLAIIRDGALGKHALQAIAHLLHVRAVLRQAQQEALGGAAAQADQAGAVQAGAAHHDARPDVQAAGHAVRLGGQRAGDAKLLAADADALSHVRSEPQQQVRRDRHRLRIERRAAARPRDPA